MSLKIMHIKKKRREEAVNPYRVADELQTVKAKSKYVSKFDRWLNHLWKWLLELWNIFVVSL